jgi:ParB family chromosome partitioning protein
MRKHLAKLLGEDDSGKIVSIPIDRIKPGLFQPRRGFDEQQMVDLARSIMMYGLIQPIVVRPWGRDYQIIAGERRFRACCLLGKTDIAAIIQAMDDDKAAAIMLMENLQRRELTYWEEAHAYSFLINTWGLPPEEMARKIGRSPAAIAEKLRLLKLPEYIQNMINDKVISEKHARALLKLNTDQHQEEVVKQIYEKELTVKETEELVERLSRHNIPSASRERLNNRNVSMIIKDARIFMNTIKETVKRARQTGIDIFMTETDSEKYHEITIRIAKEGQQNQPWAKSV